MPSATGTLAFVDLKGLASAFMPLSMWADLTLIEIAGALSFGSSELSRVYATAKMATIAEAPTRTNLRGQTMLTREGTRSDPLSW